MIICYLGGIGSGKTLSVVKNMIDNDAFCFTNMRLKKFNKYHRIKKEDIIQSYHDEEKKGKDKKSYKVNWGFWDHARKKYGRYSIYLDEIHNIAHSRRSMSRENVLISKWISQVRKILSDSTINHLYVISQTERKIDIDIRELTHVVILCTKKIIRGKVWIKQYLYDSFASYQMSIPFMRKVFLGNPYFKYYDTNEMVQFGDEEEFI